MNKAERVSNQAVNNDKVIKLKKGQRVVSVAITCASISANPVLIGWNENPSSADYLMPGESYGIVPQPGNYLDDNEIRLKFGQVDGSALAAGVNQALIKIKYEGKENIC